MSSLSPEATQPELSGLTVVLASGGFISPISIVSGSITVNSGQVAVSGLFVGTLTSGPPTAISGLVGVGLFGYDYSGKVWVPTPTATSGQGFFSTNNVNVGAIAVAPIASTLGGSLQFVAFTPNADNTNPNAVTAPIVQTIPISLDPTGGNGAAGTNGLFARETCTMSGDRFRLRVSTEGQAPTYIINSYNLPLISGAAASKVGPMVALMNYGSGTAIQSGSAYKIKGLYITPDPANPIVSGVAVKFDAIRMTSFSGGGTVISGNRFDTADPAYSGTLAAPQLQQTCYSGCTLDGVYFSYVTTNAGPYVNFSFQQSNEDVQQMNNLVATRLNDTKQIIIRSGYGFAVVQSSGNSYTQVVSGTFNIQVIYSVEGMTYVGP